MSSEQEVSSLSEPRPTQLRLWKAGAAPRGSWIVGGALLAGATALIAGSLGRPHIVDSQARPVFDTTVALGATVSFVLLWKVFRWRRQLRDLLLVGALTSGAVALMVFSSGRGGLVSPLNPQLAADGRLGFGLAVALAVLLAGLVGRRKVQLRRSRALALPAGLLAGGVVASAILRSMDVDDVIGGGTTSAAVIVVRAVTGAMFLVAAVAFADTSRPLAVFDGLLAGASILFGCSRLTSLGTSAPSTWLTLHEALTCLAYALLLLAACHQFRLRAQASLQARLQDEHVRIARDIHDGLMQDLVAITIHGARIGEQLGEEHPITVAARHALNTSRRTINDLSASWAPTTLEALCAVGEELEAKLGVEVSILGSTRWPSDADDFDADDREHLVRVAREAIVNAARHGGATRVEVELQRRDQAWILTVSDDGVGLDHARIRTAPGFGMRAMRARAAAIGGRLSTRRRDGGGTVVELTIDRANSGSLPRRRALRSRARVVTKGWLRPLTRP